MYVASLWLYKLLPLLIGMTLVAGMLIFFNLNRASVNGKLVTLHLIPHPEKLAERHFGSNANLPVSIANNRVIRLTFIIHNLETTDYQYDYNTTMKVHSTRYIIDSGRLLIKTAGINPEMSNLHA